MMSYPCDHCGQDKCNCNPSAADSKQTEIDEQIRQFEANKSIPDWAKPPERNSYTEKLEPSLAAFWCPRGKEVAMFPLPEGRPEEAYQCVTHGGHFVLLAAPSVAGTQVEQEKYLKLLRWFKLFYGFYRDDVKGKPSACASALSENSELQEFIRETDRIG